MSSNELGGFLRSRRERLTPKAAGLRPGLAHRRVPGLRREELAELAGVSVGYYTRLEQGASSSASDAVIDALAVALRLDPEEHEHLRALAAPRSPTRPRARRSVLRPEVRRLVAAMSGTPAVVIDHRVDVLGWNRLGHALLAGHLPFDAPDGRVRPNLARMLFLDPHHRALYRDWPAKATVTVSALRRAAARYPSDAGLTRLVGELATDSAEFARLWARRPVRTCAHAIRELDHPLVGALTLANETLVLPDDDQQLGLFHAEPDSPAADALALLAHQVSDRDRRVVGEVPDEHSAVPTSETGVHP
ncbi:XRE family transcriptional regulator [Nocardia panacis]|uniref:XRE family transcriptional regulator n=1 Tax=Nocardia panacis TaxID=2340916 RepID=A0A3A4KRK6_9NOCA|nr:helix-turn-helix transcriptional regulator [Nocardia panacis]RJO78490.1 XRE family transcriptional regulator [Nocardia panacis]